MEDESGVAQSLLYRMVLYSLRYNQERGFEEKKWRVCAVSGFFALCPLSLVVVIVEATIGLGLG